jgi:hypothetical protein
LLKAAVLLLFASFGLLLATFVLGWLDADLTSFRPIPRHAWWGGGALSAQLIAWILVMFNRSTNSDSRRVQIRFTTLAGFGWLLTVFAALTGLATIANWSSFWHLGVASAALAFNAGATLLLFLLMRAESKASRTESSP